jgi:hypothetical protein
LLLYPTTSYQKSTGYDESSQLGGYDALAAAVDDLIPRLHGDPSLVLVHHYELARPSAVSYEAVVNLIGGTTTKTGLTVKALLDTTS